LKLRGEEKSAEITTTIKKAEKVNLKSKKIKKEKKTSTQIQKAIMKQMQLMLKSMDEKG
jgi:hypothetical protein